MTAKEKAIELVGQFMEHTVEWDKVKEVAFDSEFHAKQCALIAIDLAIEIETNIFRTNVHKSYWKEVKQEIEKL